MTQPGWPAQPQRPVPSGQPGRGAVRPWNGQPAYQPYPPWGQPRPQRRSGGALAIVFGLVFAGVVVLALAVFLETKTDEVADPGGQRTPTSRSATPSQDTGPSPTQTRNTETPPTSESDVNPGLPARHWPALPPPNSSDPAWVTLQQNKLYSAGIPALSGCPAAERAHTLDEMETQATAQMQCIQDAWRPVLSQLGLPGEEIPIYFFEGSTVRTPCGTTSAPALYCSANGGAIYFGEDALNGSSIHDYGVKDVTGHEYGHHLQAVAGMFQAEFEIDAGNEGTRRLELQATCWGYAMIANDDSVTMNRRVFDTFEPYLRLTIEDGVHGSHESLAYWGIRGLYSTNLGNCNTWTANAEDVD